MKPPSPSARFASPLYAAMLALALAGCSGSAGDEVPVGIIASPETVYADGLALAPAAGTYRAAIADGLVGFDEDARVVPALAESWIVTDDGSSYIFRLRTGEWRDGEEISARGVAAELQRRVNSLSNTTLGRDLAIIADIRAMAGRVIEIRLKAPMPQFLSLLAQPELAVADGANPRGPMVARRLGDEAVLMATNPEILGMPVPRRWEETVRPVRVVPMSAAQAVKLFSNGAIDVVLGGTIATYPLAPSGALTRGTVRVDAAQGLFGLRVMRADGFLALPQGREALSLAIDRNGLMESFNIGGWSPRAIPVPTDISRLEDGQRPAWLSLGLEERRDIARQRVAQWRSQNNLVAPSLSVSLPDGPGSDRIYGALAGDLAAVGISLVRVDAGEPADMMLVDRVARFPSPRWYLNQLACSVSRGACSALADSLVDDALDAGSPAETERLLTEAEAELTAAAVFINFGQPLRWSLVRANITGIAPNANGYHPLPPLGVIPN